MGFTIVWPEGVIFGSIMTYHVQFLLLVLAGSTASSRTWLTTCGRGEPCAPSRVRGKRLRLSDDDRRRLAVKAQALGRWVLAEIASVATPAMLLRWYRYLIAAKYDGTKNRSPGRPPTAKDVPELMVRVARENLTWGYTRLQGALKNLGYELGRNTIKGALAEHGIAPAPERSKSMPWSTFIKAHGGAIAATDSGTRLDIRPRLGGLLHGDDPCPPKTIVEPAALGTVANTDTKLLIYGLFQKGRVLAQDAVRALESSPGLIMMMDRGL